MYMDVIIVIIAAVVLVAGMGYLFYVQYKEPVLNYIWDKLTKLFNK